MSRTIHFHLSEEVRADLDRLVSPEERDTFASEAIRQRLELLEREQTVERLDSLRRRDSPVPTEEVVRLVREARGALR